MASPCTVVTFGNFKGGTGKTTNSTMISYALAKMGYKVLFCDFDPQGDATNFLLETKAQREPDMQMLNKTLMVAVQERNLESIITPITDNLYLLPSYEDFANFPLLLVKMFTNHSQRIQYFATLIEPLKDQFDFIIIDTPPTKSMITDSALFASDFAVVSLQTQARSLQQAKNFIRYLQELIDVYGADLDVLGILPVLIKDATVDNITLETAIETFGEEHVFKNYVKQMERLKRFDLTGITENDRHDKKVIARYITITEEFLDRLPSEVLERHLSIKKAREIENPESAKRKKSFLDWATGRG